MPRGNKTVGLSLSPEVLEEVERLAREENMSRSEVLLEAVRHYIRTQRRWQRLYRWGEESATKMGVASEAQVDELVHQFRREQSETIGISHKHGHSEQSEESRFFGRYAPSE